MFIQRYSGLIRNFGQFLFSADAGNRIQGGLMCEESACTDELPYVCDANRPPTNPVEQSENTLLSDF